MINIHVMSRDTVQSLRCLIAAINTNIVVSVAAADVLCVCSMASSYEFADL